MLSYDTALCISLCNVRQYSMTLQYRHLIPAPVDRTSASARLYKHHLATCQKNKPSTSIVARESHVPNESKLRLVVWSPMHPCPRNWMAIGCTVVYYVQAAHVIKCRHCICLLCPSRLATTMCMSYHDMMKQELYSLYDEFQPRLILSIRSLYP